MKVLSLFDGMSCGQIALKRLGIRTETYYASEIDRHAIRQTQLNFPDTIQLGDVTQVDVRQLEPIDLLIGGSPCQPYRDLHNPNQSIPQWQKDLAGWADKRWIFLSCEFKDFIPRKGFKCSTYFNHKTETNEGFELV